MLLGVRRASTSVSLLAPATTAAACRRPGWRERRSIGPEIDTAATTRPDGPADRRGHRGDARLALADALRPAAAADAGQRRGGERAPCRPRCSRSGSSQASRTCAAEPASIVSVAPTGIESRRPIGPLGGGDADALVALAAEELGALAGVVAQGAEHRAGRGEQAVLAGGRGELAEPRARARSGPACRGRPGGGARGRRRAGGPSGGPARWRRRAGPGSPARPRGRRARWRPCRERRLRWSCPCTDTAVSGLRRKFTARRTQSARILAERRSSRTTRSTEDRTWQDAGREGVGRARRPPGRGRARPPLHRPPPRSTR